jgi:hypothetical protein
VTTVAQPAAADLAPSPGLIVGASAELTGQDKARLRRVCDYLIDSEDELIYVTKNDPSMQPVVDRVVELLVYLTRRAHE